MEHRFCMPKVTEIRPRAHGGAVLAPQMDATLPRAQRELVAASLLRRPHDPLAKVSR